MKNEEEIIGKFMGLKYVPWNGLHGPYDKPGWWVPEESIKPAIYNSGKFKRFYGRRLSYLDWDNLMKIIDRIENTSCKHLSYNWEMNEKKHYNYDKPIVEIFGKDCDIYFDSTLDGVITIISNSEETKREAILKSVISFIEWFNERTKEEKENEIS